LGLYTIRPHHFCAYFEGGGGFVAVTILDKEGFHVIDIQSREWEYDAKKFLRMI
jgi:hypothetical protein